MSGRLNGGSFGWLVVQLAERLTLDQEVPGSIPGEPVRWGSRGCRGPFLCADVGIFVGEPAGCTVMVEGDKQSDGTDLSTGYEPAHRCPWCEYPSDGTVCPECGLGVDQARARRRDQAMRRRRPWESVGRVFLFGVLYVLVVLSLQANTVSSSNSSSDPRPPTRINAIAQELLSIVSAPTEYLSQRISLYVPRFPAILLSLACVGCVVEVAYQVTRMVWKMTRHRTSVKENPPGGSGRDR